MNRPNKIILLACVVLAIIAVVEAQQEQQTETTHIEPEQVPKIAEVDAMDGATEPETRPTASQSAMAMSTPHYAETSAHSEELPYSEEDIITLSKMVWGEARGVSAKEQAMCVWTVLNRLDNGRWGDSIQSVTKAKGQFIGYKAKHPVADEIRAVVEDVLEAWTSGEEALIHRPYAKKSRYLYFSSRNGHNYFR